MSTHVTTSPSAFNPHPLQFAHQADAYLEWALATQWKGFQQNADRVAILVQRKPDVEVDQLKKWLSDHKSDVEMATCYFDYLHAVLVVKQQFLQSPPGQAACSNIFERFELATALTQPSKFPMSQGWSNSQKAWHPKAETIAACIDDAFPIASQRFFDRTGQSRLLRMWDQGQSHFAWHALGNHQTGMPTADFSYGGEIFNGRYLQTMAPTASTPPSKVVHWLKKITDLFTTPMLGASKASTHEISVPSERDAQDDAAYYERWGMKQLRRHHTHGSHVLDTLAGPIPVANRVPTSRRSSPGSDAAASVSPTWKEEPIGEQKHADLVLVQLPKSAINDPSGRWLGHHVLDGLHYILQASGAAKKIVTNISWGPQTGPHDGSSLLELAMDELLCAHRQLSITLPAGNSFQARAHAHWTVDSAAAPRSLTWCIPPAIKHLSFLEIWSDQKDAFEVALISPTGKTTTLNRVGIQKGSDCGLVQLLHNQNRAMALVAVHPTESDGATVRAPHGQWQVQITLHKKPERTAQFHAYIARSSSNIGSSYQQPDSYLFDPAYEDLRREPPHRQKLALKGQCVTQEGTLNGIGTGQDPQLYVLAGYRLTDGQPAPYSSSGPVVGNGALRPDFAFPTDESPVLQGLLGGATRAGSVVRLTGTSTAAPQMGRRLLATRSGSHSHRHGYGNKT